MDEFQACLALRHTKGIGPRTWKALVDRFGSALAAVNAYPHWEGLVSASVRAVFGQGAWKSAAHEEFTRARDVGCAVCVLSDPAYPSLLRQIPDPPLFLYARGDLSLLERPCVAVVGSRRSSRYGVRMAESIARTLSHAGVCVVSGCAFGIDRAAHWGALQEIGSTIAVLGTGIDVWYPASNRDVMERIQAMGLVLTEFAPGTKPEGINFPHRNRIVSGLALGVLVVEAALKSGSLITAELAVAQNREVFALPGPATMKSYEGCHQLIRQGACLVLDGEDILRELEPRLLFFAPRLPREGKDSLVPDDPEQRAVFQLVSPDDQVHIDALTRQLGWPAEKVSATLLFLELQGFVEQFPGMYYSRKLA